MKNQMAVQADVERTSTALVVDDEPVICEYLAEVLRDFGMNVLCAQTVREAMEIAHRKIAIDVAFVDLNLPDRSGLELIAELRQVRPELRVVIASTYSAMAGADSLDSSTTELVLGKPYNPESIAKILVRMNLPQV
jgi:CheY-like chemotaxis protein